MIPYGSGMQEEEPAAEVKREARKSVVPEKEMLIADMAGRLAAEVSGEDDGGGSSTALFEDMDGSQ